MILHKKSQLKRVKISGRKLSLIVRCFSTDITASSCYSSERSRTCAEIVHVNRNTSNRFYGYCRTLVLKDQERERREFLSEDETEIDEAYFGPTRVRGKRGCGAGRKIAVVGLLQRAGKVFTKPVDRCTAEEIMPILRAKLAQGVDVYTDGWKSYDALAAYGFNHKKVIHEENEFSDGDGNHINGISKNLFGDYLKETEWRFNNRGTIKKRLRRLIRKDRRVI